MNAIPNCGSTAQETVGLNPCWGGPRHGEFARFFTNEPIEEHKLPKPRPLLQAEKADPYPVEALPPLIRDVVAEVAGYVQAPAAMIVASALAAVSTAV